MTQSEKMDISILFGGVSRDVCVSVGWSVGWLVGRSVGRVTHSFDDPHVAPYWPTWPCFVYSL